MPAPSLPLGPGEGRSRPRGSPAPPRTRRPPGGRPWRRGEAKAAPQRAGPGRAGPAARDLPAARPSAGAAGTGTGGGQAGPALAFRAGLRLLTLLGQGLSDERAGGGRGEEGIRRRKAKAAAARARARRRRVPRFPAPAGSRRPAPRFRARPRPRPSARWRRSRRSPPARDPALPRHPPPH